MRRSRKLKSCIKNKLYFHSSTSCCPNNVFFIFTRSYLSGFDNPIIYIICFVKVWLHHIQTESPHWSQQLSLSHVQLELMCCWISVGLKLNWNSVSSTPADRLSVRNWSTTVSAACFRLTRQPLAHSDALNTAKKSLFSSLGCWNGQTQKVSVRNWRGSKREELWVNIDSKKWEAVYTPSAPH